MARRRRRSKSKKKFYRKLMIAAAAVGVLAVSGYGLVQLREAHKIKTYYAAAQSFIQKGAPGQAIAPLQSLLRLDYENAHVRVMLANTLLSMGQVNEAYRNYRLVLIHDPTNVEAAQNAARIAFLQAQWDDAARFVQIALTYVPGTPDIQAIKIGLDYRAALVANDEGRRNKAVQAATTLLSRDPSLLNARRVLIADRLKTQDFRDAMRLTDDGLSYVPENRDLQNTKLILFDKTGDQMGYDQQLQRMMAQSPNDRTLFDQMVARHIQFGRLDQAEAMLRARVIEGAKQPAPRMAMMQFLHDHRPVEVLQNELGALLSQTPPPADIAADLPDFQIMLAQSLFTSGKTDQATQGLRKAIPQQDVSPSANRMRVALATMYQDLGDGRAAQSLIDTVLTKDPAQFDAQKMRGRQLVQARQYELAIPLLRNLLLRNPNDPDLMTWLASSYQGTDRDGLVGDLLLQAMEAGQGQAKYVLNYVRWLLNQKDSERALAALNNPKYALPQTADVLLVKSQSYVMERNWDALGGTIDLLKKLDLSNEDRGTVNALALQMQQGRAQDIHLLQLITDLSHTPNSPDTARWSIITASLKTGDIQQALTDTMALASDMPTRPEPKFLAAQMLADRGDPQQAMEQLRRINMTHPTYVPAWLMLEQLELKERGPIPALGTLDAALLAVPGDPALLLDKALLHQQMGNTVQAISVYEALLTKTPDDPLIRNNLAGLLVDVQPGQAAPEASRLERAWALVAPLRDVQVPAYQDTYGWVAFLRGDSETALRVLQQAFKTDPENPMIAYHLGKVYVASNQMDAARDVYKQAEKIISERVHSGQPSAQTPQDIAFSQILSQALYGL